MLDKNPIDNEKAKHIASVENAIALMNDGINSLVRNKKISVEERNSNIAKCRNNIYMLRIELHRLLDILRDEEGTDLKYRAEDFQTPLVGES